MYTCERNGRFKNYHLEIASRLSERCLHAHRLDPNHILFARDSANRVGVHRTEERRASLEKRIGNGVHRCPVREKPTQDKVCPACVYQCARCSRFVAIATRTRCFATIIHPSNARRICISTFSLLSLLFFPRFFFANRILANSV